MLKHLFTVFFFAIFLSAGTGQALAQTFPGGGYKDPGSGRDPNCEVREDIDDIANGPPDPGAEGPHFVWEQIYDLGYDAADLPEFEDPVEMRGEVTFPINLDCGPYPVIFIMHGGHPTCIDQDGDFYEEWPCREDIPVPCEGGDPESLTTGLCTVDDTPLYNHQGYGYLARRLASHGFIVISISANGINAVANWDVDNRARLLQNHMELWEQFNTVGGAPFGNQFINALDLQNVGTIGHSRGGGAIVRQQVINANEGAPFGIQALLQVAPVSNGPESHAVPDAALGTVLPYCDGDQADFKASAISTSRAMPSPATLDRNTPSW